MFFDKIRKLEGVTSYDILLGSSRKDHQGDTTTMRHEFNLYIRD